MKPDRIEREIVIAAPIDRVWQVVTAPEHVGVWFGQGQPAKIDLRPGGTMVLDHGEHGVFPTRIVTVEEPHRFSYRWASAFPASVRSRGQCCGPCRASRQSLRVPARRAGLSPAPSGPGGARWAVTAQTLHPCVPD